MAHSGLRGLTHRAVDAEAGLPQGSCSAYMRTRLALLTRLTEYVTAQFALDLTDLTQRIEEHGEVDGYVVRETVAMLRSWLEEPDLLLVRIELTIEGARQPAVNEILLEQGSQLVGIVEHAMASTGKEPDHGARTDADRGSRRRPAARRTGEPGPARGVPAREPRAADGGTLVGRAHRVHAPGRVLGWSVAPAARSVPPSTTIPRRPTCPRQ